MSNQSLHLVKPQSESSPIRRVGWQEFLALFEWEQGEHVTLIGPTGSGKTTLAKSLLPRRKYIVIFATKRKDDTLRDIQRDLDFKRMSTWNPELANRVIFAPKLNPDNVSAQREAFNRCMTDIFNSGGWCVFWDEVTYLSRFLGLESKMSVLWQQGRSLGISIVAGTQRPAYVPLYAYDQATHLFFWKDNDQVNLKRLSNLGGMDALPIRNAVSQLAKHEIFYLNTRDGEMLITLPEVS